MVAVLDDPNGPTLSRVSGQAPYPDPNNPALPPDIVPRQVMLRDRQTVATIVPIASRHQLPPALAAYLCDQINREIEGGDTYPMMDAFTPDGFARYWFQDFGAVMLLGSVASTDDVLARDYDYWARQCLGSMYIRPNYPGRSSHVCNAGFIVTDGSRNRGVGRLMGEAYIDWAPRLGYTYSVFNLVYETNVASCRIWDALGFKRIGRVKGCGNLRSHPDRLIDAIIYGRDMVPGDSDDLVSEERFDKIKFYLKYGKYPNGADRAEKSRLRSAATHYKLLPGDKLMLKDKEVIADPARQYDIARAVHVAQHAGINKTTATIAERYHWSRIKETVSDVIRNCADCKEQGKTPNAAGAARRSAVATGPSPAAAVTPTPSPTPPGAGMDGMAPPPTTVTARELSKAENPAAVQVLALQDHDMLPPTLTTPFTDDTDDHHHHHHTAYANPNDITVMAPSHTLQDPTPPPGMHHHTHHTDHHHHHSPMLHDHASAYQPIDPRIINQASPAPDNPFEHYSPHADFQALLSATEDDINNHHHHQHNHHHHDVHPDNDGVDGDLDMLIDHRRAAEEDDDSDDGDAAMHGLHGGEGEHGLAVGSRSKVLYTGGFDEPGG
ncbi:hypothetical protein S7711_02144 [Stachybotrys chartarum IBT 7711]|uniref:N-acetyltransferase domain-containing protein n=1 Tax=Stachybotrys chartarum (strain CBS 109288 / IBT 7711) TaxID=1280523 RepID=A0A084ARK7_STACB|nr:hypothetical protein S7711_02144 [Stachybotrys chartarum IBT 7711]